MVAELVLRVAADPNALKGLNTEELKELLAEPEPPRWVFTEAARRFSDEGVMAHLFAHPKAPPELLRRVAGSVPYRLERFQHHVAVHTGPRPTLKAVLSQVIPESVAFRLSPPQQTLVVSTLPPRCLLRLAPLVSNGVAKDILYGRLQTELGNDAFYLPYAATSKPPRAYSWAAQFLLLGDFLSYLTLEEIPAVRELPVLARVALALNRHQPLEPQLGDADMRVRMAGEERKTWREN